MKPVRVGVLGLGNMGTSYAQRLRDGDISNAVLAAVCKVTEEKEDWAREQFPHGISYWQSAEEMMSSGEVDAVIVATPHYSHPEEAMRAFKHGLHVLIEKPAGVHTKQIREMNEAAAGSGKVFAIMYNQRTNPVYQKLKELILDGELGEIRRTNWIVTHWFRAQSYYDMGSWRATWSGEGGGVLVNQSAHQLDLWQWTTGLLPTRIRAFCSFGKYHDIEVEDDVTAYVEYENGATGVFITSTGEAPGTNRFEVTGDLGKVVIENDQLVFWKLRQSAREFSDSYTGGFGHPECWKCEVPIEGEMSSHTGIIQNWIDAILSGVSLLAPGEEGIHAVTLSNAMYMSTWQNDWVNLPLDDDSFVAHLDKLIHNNKINKK